MQAVILAGGYGTRISEESHLKPKPMIEIGGKPIIWHIMKIYSSFGINDFIICCGYKGYLIKEYFANYALHASDITFHMKTNKLQVHRRSLEDWNVTLIDTGEGTSTGGRLKRIKNYIKDTFCMTYGDGVADININKLIEFHFSHKKKATLTAVCPPGRFGALEIEGNIIKTFTEKPKGDGNLVNGGFFVLEPSVLELIDSDNIMWENEPCHNLAISNELMAYKHNGFWRPMDTIRDKKVLQELWDTKKAPWKRWE